MIALAALAVAIGAWFRPAPKPEAPAAKTYSEQEVAEAKAAVCGAFEKVRMTLATTGGKTGSDPTDSFVVAVNTRLAMETASNFLQRRLDDYPATPTAVAEPVRVLSHSYEEIALAQLADTPEAGLIALAHTADDEVAKINRACQ